MIRRILYVAALLAGVCEASAAGRAEEILGRVAEGFRAMKDYTVRFEVAADEYRTPGSYAVRGGSYYLRLGDDAEVYSDGRLRYEVDNRRREVTVTEVNRASRNILDNPVRASTSSAASTISRSKGRAEAALRCGLCRRRRTTLRRAW